MTKLARSHGGFTLIELIAVISIISMMLFFAIPRLGNDGESGGDLITVSRWILINVQALKSRSGSEHKLLALHVQFDANAFSITDPSVSEDDMAKTPQEYRLPQHVIISDVEYPGKGAVTTEGTDILFYPKGYSDKAILHLKDDEGDIYSILIEPFLPTATLYEEYISFF